MYYPVLKKKQDLKGRIRYEINVFIEMVWTEFKGVKTNKSNKGYI